MSDRPPLPTHRVLRRLLVAMVGLVAVAVAAVLTALAGIDDRATTVRDRTAPAVLEVSTARLAVERAYDSAITSFSTGQVELTGPGERYVGQLALATQSLARSAETNEAGSGGTRAVEVTTGLLAGFGDAIEQADAHARAKEPTLALADLVDASGLLHEPDGLLDQIDHLSALQRDAARSQVEGSPVGPVAIAVRGVATVALLVALVVVQRVLARRFRRRFNVPLAAATVTVVGALVLTVPALHGAGTLRDTLAALDVHTAAATGQAVVSDIHGQQALGALLRAECDTACSDAEVAAASGSIASAAPPGPAVDDLGAAADTVAKARTVNELAAAADDLVHWDTVLLVLFLVVGFLVVLGLWSRITDYRFAPS